jgi:predicted MPP superfamily phosphohydrolase
VFFDILKGINRLVHLLPAELMRSRRVRYTNLALLIAIPGTIVLAGKFWNGYLQVNEYRIDVARQSSPLTQLTIAVASDFHLREFTDPGLLSEFAGRVNGLKADLLLLPGDIVEGDRPDARAEEFAQAFRTIATTYGTFVSMGNHESHGVDDKLHFFQQSGMTALRDTAVMIDSAFWLIGRNDSRERDRKSIASLLGTIPRVLPVIVLDHKPTDLGSISASGVDVVVSGHTHHGQLWPFNFITDRVYELSWGHQLFGKTHAFVTSGIQVWGPPVRTAGESEIMLIRVNLR